MAERVITEQVRWNGPVSDEHRSGELLWTIEAHDDQPIGDGKKYAADLRVLVLLNGERVREFTYPSYRIWTLLAHWTEGLGDLTAELLAAPVPHPAATDPSDGGGGRG